MNEESKWKKFCRIVRFLFCNLMILVAIAGYAWGWYNQRSAQFEKAAAQREISIMQEKNAELLIQIEYLKKELK